MAKRLSVLLAIALALGLLVGCGLTDGPEQAPLAAYDGTWYMANNGVACAFADGKIYRDDRDAKEGQTLSGIYSDVDGHAEAHLTGVGGVSVARPLYIVRTDSGDVLCDSADGTGTIYFYRDALTVLALLEEAERTASTTTPVAEDIPSPDAGPDDSESSASPSPTDQTEPTGGAETPVEEATVSGSTVWVSKSGSKYHTTPSCSGMKNPAKMSKADAERKGYTPCKRCH